MYLDGNEVFATIDYIKEVFNQNCEVETHEHYMLYKWRVNQINMYITRHENYGFKFTFMTQATEYETTLDALSAQIDNTIKQLQADINEISP